MSYKVSNKYKESRYSGDNDNQLYLKYNEVEVKDAPLKAENLKWNRRILDNGSKTLTLDNFVSQTIELSIRDYEVSDTTKEFYIKIGSMVDGAYEYVPLGYFHIKDNPSTANGKTTYKLTDRSTRFDKFIDLSEFIKQNGGKITKLQAVQEYCRQCNVEFANTSFLGSNEEIGIYDNTITARVHIMYLAECSGCIATIGRDGKLYFIPFVKPNSNNTHIIPDRILNNNMNNSKGSFKISKVVWEGALMPFSKGNDTGDTLFLNTSNPYISKQEDIDRIYEQVVGLEIDNINTSSIIGDPSIDPWDYIQYTHTDDNGNNKETYTSLAQYDLEFNGVFKQTFNTSIDREKKKINSTVNSQNAKVNRLKQEIDNVNGVLKVTSEKVDENTSKIGSLEISNQGITTKISTLETGLNTTNNNLKDTNSRVDTLDGKIDGVSADFTDFKDNEYIQSINNLQDQIDGAIQFWNGASIPTLENYPANEWKTENDRNNHRADIYTVIDDSTTPPKQGKSYRFDKVNGVWQWIELTDNELSAVQAIAQEALDKAKANAGNIDVLTQKTSELTQTDEQIKASVTEINNKYEQDITTSKTATGNPIEIEDAGEYPLESIEIEGNVEQETTTGKNLINVESNLTFTRSKTIQVNIPAGTYHITNASAKASDNSKYITIGFANNGVYNLSTSRDRIITLNNDETTVYLFSKTDYPTSNGISATITNLMISLTGGEYEPYTGGIPAPNPDYPMEVRTLKGWNLLKLQDGTYNNNGISANVEKGKITLNGTATGTSFVSIPIESLNIDNSNYVYSINNTQTISDNNSMARLYKANDDFFKSCYFNKLNGEVNLLNNGGVYNQIQIRTSSGVTYNNFIIKPQLTKGTKQKPYFPYGAIGIERIGKNWFDKDSISQVNSWEYVLSNLFEKAGTYSFKLNNTSFFGKKTSYFTIKLANSTTSSSSESLTIANMNTSNSISVNITDEMLKYPYIKLFPNSQNRLNEIKDSQLQIELGEPTEYEPYQESTALIDMNIYDEEGNITGYHEFCSVPQTKDTFKDGVLTKRIRKIVLDGSEKGWVKFRFSNDTISSFFLINTLLGINFKGAYICDKFIFDSDINNDTTKEYISNVAGNGLLIGIFKTRIESDTPADFKKWLSENPITVYYVLKEPQTYQLPYEILKLHKGYNNITLNDELLPNMNIEYLTDSKLNAQYVSHTQLEIEKNKINSEINTKVSNTELGEVIEEQNNKITQQITDSENEIMLEVNKKVDNEDYTRAKIMAKITENGTSAIDMEADKFSLTSDNFKVDIEGNLEAKSAKLENANIVNGDIKLTDDGTTTNVPKIIIESNDKKYTTELRSRLVSSPTFGLQSEYVNGIEYADDSQYQKQVIFNNGALSWFIDENGKCSFYGIDSDDKNFDISSNKINLNGANLSEDNGGLTIQSKQSSNSKTGANGIWLGAGGNITLNPGANSKAYVRVGSGSSYAISTAGGNISSANLKNIKDKFKDIDYNEALKLLDFINLYHYDYKYKINDYDNNYGFIIDELEENELTKKFFNFEDNKAVITENNTLDEELATREDNQEEVINYKRYDNDVLIKYLLTVCKAQQKCIENLQNDVNELKSMLSKEN